MARHKIEDDRANDRHGWKKSDSKSIIRIDHSDVYIENDRLGEDLEFTMASLHRSKYKQFLNRDSQIIELKKSLARMRQGNVGGSILNRTTIGKRDSRTRVPPETQTSPSRVTESSYDKTPRRKKKTSFQFQHSFREGPATPVQKVKNISITMPDVDKNASRNDASTDEGDDDDDDDDITIHSDESIDHDKPRRKTTSRPGTGKIKSPKKENNIRRSKSCTFDDPYATNKSNLSLKKLKKMLRLDDIPATWYTSVVPASDVSFNRRAGRSNLYELTNPRNNPHVTSWKPPRVQSARPGQKSTKSPEERNNYDSFARRPHTSLGVSSNTESKESNPNQSHCNSPTSGNRQASRPMTAASHQSQKMSNGSSKTVRQLKELSEQDEQATIFNRPRSSLEVMLDETKEERKIIDHKINAFLKSLDELQKAKRWKDQGLNIHQMRSIPGIVNLTSFSSTTVTGDLLSRDENETNSAWRSVHRPSGSKDSTKLDKALKDLASRPTTVP